MTAPVIAAPARHHFSARYLRDWVYGGLDGTVTTFAIAAGVAGASLGTGTILILGFANLIADGFSMAAGAFSAGQADREVYARELAEERRGIAADPRRARERLKADFAKLGLKGERVAAAIDAWPETELAAALLIEQRGPPDGARRPLAAAIHTYAAFVACGLLPLLPFLFGFGFQASVIAAAAAFFAIGSLKSRWTMVPWWRSGSATLGVGGVAAVIAYGIGFLLRQLVGVAL